MSRKIVETLARWLAVVVFILIPFATLGCQLSSKIIESRLSLTEQQSEILKIAPIGTSRDEAIAKLKKAGISGSFSAAGQSIYYCDLWVREDGERWHMHVALLFDQDGKLYKTRGSDSQITQGPAKSGADSRGELATGNRVQGRTSTNSGTAGKTAGNRTGMESVSGQSEPDPSVDSPASQTNSARADRRRPFSNDNE